MPTDNFGGGLIYDTSDLTNFYTYAPNSPYNPANIVSPAGLSTYAQKFIVTFNLTANAARTITHGLNLANPAAFISKFVDSTNTPIVVAYSNMLSNSFDVVATTNINGITGIVVG